MMSSLSLCVVTALIWCAPAHRTQASDRPAGEILAEIDAIRAATPNAQKDPALLARLRADPAAREEFVNGGGKVQRGAGAERRPKWATPLV
jgi:hypothetical protein